MQGDDRLQRAQHFVEVGVVAAQHGLHRHAPEEAHHQGQRHAGGDNVSVYRHNAAGPGALEPFVQVEDQRRQMAAQFLVAPGRLAMPAVLVLA